MNKLAGILFVFGILFLLSSCAPTKETTKDDTIKQDSTYVFDQTTPGPEIKGTYYLVQVGAFTTQEKADQFAEQFRKKMNKEVNISFSNGINLFVVQLNPRYTDRKEAEKVRDEIKNIKEFSDVWILTVNK